MAQEPANVYGLGYLGLRAPDLAVWDTFALDVLGLGGADPVGGERRYRLDDRAYRLSVVGGDPGVDHMGWEVRGPRELDVAIDALTAAGTTVTAADDDLRAHRGVMDLVRCQDPVGNQLELFWGAAVQATTPLASRHGNRFVTADQGLGHFVVTASRYEETVVFYQRTLGFATSDVMLGTPSVTFLSPNPRHHSIAIVDAPVEMFHHFMVEVTDMDMVGSAYDRVQDANLQLVMTLGRHWNDRVMSFYVESPSGCAVEFGWGGLRVDRSTWTTVRGTGEISFWGHRPVTEEMKAMIGTD